MSYHQLLEHAQYLLTIIERLQIRGAQLGKWEIPEVQNISAKVHEALRDLQAGDLELPRR